ASLRQVAYHGMQADAATLEGDGTALHHEIKAGLRAAGAELQVAAVGSWRGGSWAGDILRGSGRDGVGPWRLSAPGRLTVTTAGISLSPLVVTGMGEERV